LSGIGAIARVYETKRGTKCNLEHGHYEPRLLTLREVGKLGVVGIVVLGNKGGGLTRHELTRRVSFPPLTKYLSRVCVCMSE